MVRAICSANCCRSCSEMISVGDGREDPATLLLLIMDDLFGDTTTGVIPAQCTVHTSSDQPLSILLFLSIAHSLVCHTLITGTTTTTTTTTNYYYTLYLLLLVLLRLWHLPVFTTSFFALLHSSYFLSARPLQKLLHSLVTAIISHLTL